MILDKMGYIMTSKPIAAKCQYKAMEQDISGEVLTNRDRDTDKLALL